VFATRILLRFSLDLTRLFLPAHGRVIIHVDVIVGPAHHHSMNKRPLICRLSICR